MQYSSADPKLLSFEVSVLLHNIAGHILTINYLIFIFGNIFTENRKHYIVKSKGMLKRIIRQTRYYTFGMFKGEKAPYKINEDHKFNPLQQITYRIIMYFFVPMIILTGILMMMPDKVLQRLPGFNFLLVVDLAHIIAGFVISVFLIIHLYFSTIGHKKSSNFKSIITGWHDIDE
jgi:thiosulfate reductase cytochrome b subunit